MNRSSLVLVAGAFVVSMAHHVSAQTTPAAPASQGSPMLQPWTDRGYFNFNIGFETTSGTLTDNVSFTLYEETGTKSVEQNVDSGSFIDFSAGSRVWRNVSVGLGFHRGTNTSEATGTASVPHPVFFNRNRLATVAANDLERTEYAVHLQFGYMIPVNDVFSIHVTGGPSFFRLEQDVIGDMTFTEGPGNTTVTAAPTIITRTDSVTGLNIGVDVMYLLYDSDPYRIGGGAFIRYAGASARIPVIANEVDTDVGGLQIGFGARLRF
jgi:hypothetical protein